jgi:hypothetical protein
MLKCEHLVSFYNFFCSTLSEFENFFLCERILINGPLKRSFHSRFNLAHSYQKKPNLHTNSLNK